MTIDKEFGPECATCKNSNNPARTTCWNCGRAMQGQHYFHMPASLTWITDGEGNVKGIRIEPIDNPSPCSVDESGYVGAMSDEDPRHPNAMYVMSAADANGWYFPVLASLPDGVDWVA